MQAATTYFLDLGEAASSGSQRARRIADAVAAGSLRTRLERALPPLAGRIHARLIRADVAAVLDGWPLGYHVVALDSSHAELSVWHLDVAASSTLGLASVDYATTIYYLRRVDGAWRIESADSASGPTPPPAGGPAIQVDAFARAASGFSRYHYAP